jgi:hypothetical protein
MQNVADRHGSGNPEAKTCPDCPFYSIAKNTGLKRITLAKSAPRVGIGEMRPDMNLRKRLICPIVHVGHLSVFVG